MGLLPIEGAELGPDGIKSDTCLMALRMTRVPYKETESLPIPTNIDTDPDWTGRGVFDGVFHQLVKDHRRDRETAEPLVLADIDSKQLLHPHFLKIQIGTDEL